MEEKFAVDNQTFERLENLQELLEYYESYRLDSLNRAVADCNKRLKMLSRLIEAFENPSDLCRWEVKNYNKYIHECLTDKEDLSTLEELEKQAEEYRDLFECNPEDKDLLTLRAVKNIKRLIEVDTRLTLQAAKEQYAKECKKKPSR